MTTQEAIDNILAAITVYRRTLEAKTTADDRFTSLKEQARDAAETAAKARQEENEARRALVKAIGELAAAEAP